MVLPRCDRSTVNHRESSPPSLGVAHSPKDGKKELQWRCAMLAQESACSAQLICQDGAQSWYRQGYTRMGTFLTDLIRTTQPYTRDLWSRLYPDAAVQIGIRGGKKQPTLLLCVMALHPPLLPSRLSLEQAIKPCFLTWASTISRFPSLLSL